ncbi:helix-loop-helix DNA-binding domain-containing protein [Apiospora arundinis]
MSSANRSLPQSQPGDAVSREDFELLQRFLRVARLLQDQNVNIDPALTQQNHRYPESEHTVPITNNTSRTPPSVGQSASGAHPVHSVDVAGSYDEEEDEYDENDDLVGAEEDDSYGEETRMPQSVNTRSSAQRQRQQQQQQQQQQRRQQDQQTREANGQQRQEQQEQEERLQRGGKPPPPPSHQQQGQQSRHPPSQNRWPRPHAAVEKRYRSVLNSKIQQLSAAMPASNTFDPSVAASSSLSSSSPPPPPGTSASRAPGPAGQQPAKAETKPVVLDRAIHYVNHLVATYEQYESEQDLLRRKLQLWLDDAASLERVNPVQL